jgi:hypothetical protein
MGFIEKRVSSGRASGAQARDASSVAVRRKPSLPARDARNVTRETEARRDFETDRWRAGKACAWFLTKPSAISIKHPPAQGFFAYPQEMWISLWINRSDRLSGAHR